MIQIPVYKPSLLGNEAKYVNECLSSTWISSKGDFIGKFECSFGEYVSVRYSVAVCNGTVALHLALMALGIGPGDEVIVPSLTYIASVNAIAYCGGTPVFADCQLGTWQIDPDQIEKKITHKTKAIVAVHLYGHPCDMARISQIAKSRALFLVEDCAEAIGTRIGNQHVGLWSDISTYSFFGNKTITTGEGGMVCTMDARLHDRIRRLKGQGLASHRQYWHDMIGYNYRMTNICAAIGLAQLERIDDIIAKKRRLSTYYVSHLSNLPIEFQTEAPGTTHSFWMNSILLSDERDREPLMAHLLNAGIETRPVFYPVHTMHMYAERFQRLPNTESISARGINLPSWPDLSEVELGQICSAIRTYYIDKP